MLYLIGLGLSSPRDITLSGLDAVRQSSRVYLEAYTSILMDARQDELEELYGKKIILADRDMVEAESEDIVRNADTEDVSFLVVGDPFGATTHADLLLRCDTASPPIPYRIIHNASIMNAVGACGLALYNFGQTVSIPFFTDTWRPDSWLTRVRENWGLGLHTLCLVDIKVKEQSEENLARGRKIYEPARYMSIPTAISQLLSLLPSAPSTDSAHPLSPDTTLAISVSRLGSPSQRLVSGTLAELSSLDEPAFGPPLHSLVLVGRQLHPMERDFAAKWAVDQQKWQQVARTVYGCTG